MKNTVKYLVIVLVTLLFGCGISYATFSFTSKNVVYDNTETSLTSTNIQDVIDEIFEKTGNSSSDKTVIGTYHRYDTTTDLVIDTPASEYIVFGYSYGTSNWDGAKINTVTNGTFTKLFEGSTAAHEFLIYDVKSTDTTKGITISTITKYGAIIVVALDNASKNALCGNHQIENGKTYIIKDGVVQDGFEFEAKAILPYGWGGTPAVPSVSSGDGYLRIGISTGNQGTYILKKPVILSGYNRLIMKYKYITNVNSTYQSRQLSLSGTNTTNLQGSTYGADEQQNARTELFHHFLIDILKPDELQYVAISVGFSTIDVYDLWLE